MTASETIPEHSTDDSEILSSQQALFLSIFLILLSVATLAYYTRQQRKQAKAESLGLNYKFLYPPEKELFEKKLLEEPEDEPEESEKYQQWLKEICSILMKRAMMSLQLNMKVTQDYKEYYMIYKNGITLDVWESVQNAKKEVDKELLVIQEEAEMLRPGWGQMIFQQANQLRQAMMLRQKQAMEAAKNGTPPPTGPISVGPPTPELAAAMAAAQQRALAAQQAQAAAQQAKLSQTTNAPLQNGDEFSGLNGLKGQLSGHAGPKKEKKARELTEEEKKRLAALMAERMAAKEGEKVEAK